MGAPGFIFISALKEGSLLGEYIVGDQGGPILEISCWEGRRIVGHCEGTKEITDIIVKGGTEECSESHSCVKLYLSTVNMQNQIGIMHFDVIWVRLGFG